MRRECGVGDGREQGCRPGAAADGARIHRLPDRSGDMARERYHDTAEQPDAVEQLGYMADMIAQMQAMAEQAGQPILERLLALARAEAVRAAEGGAVQSAAR